MINLTKSIKNKKNSIHGSEGKKRRRVAHFAIFVVFVVTLQILGKNISYYEEQVTSYMGITLNSELKRATDEEEVYEIYDEMIQSSGQYLLEYCSNYLRENGTESSNINALGTKLPVNLYFVFDDGGVRNDSVGSIIKAEDSNPLTLNIQEFNTLCENGFFSKLGDDGEYFYRSRDIGNGTIIISYQEESLSNLGLTINSAYSSYSGELILWVDANNNIFLSNNDSYVGKSYDSVSTIRSSTGKIASIDGLGICASRCTKLGSNTLYTFVPVSVVISDIIRGAIVPIILLWIVAITLLTYAVKISRNRYKKEREYGEEQAESDIILFNKISLNRQIVSHLIALGIFGMILISISLFYVRALISYCDQNLLANANLKTLSEAYTTNMSNRDKADANNKKEFADYADIIAWGYKLHPENVNSDSLKNMVDGLSIINSIIVTDSKGTIVASTTNEDGYTIGRGDDEMYQCCWQVLDGKADSAAYHEGTTEDGGFSYVVVVRRQDANGAVIINAVVEHAASFVEKWTLEEAMLTTDIGDATCYAMYLDEPDKVYVAEPNASNVTILDTTLSNSILQNGYAGINRIKGVNYYVNSLLNADDNLMFISALPLRNIPFTVAWSSFWSILLGMIVFLTTLIVGFGSSITENESADGENTDNNDQGSNIFSKDTIIDEGFKKVFRNMIIATGVLLVLLLAVDYMFKTPSLVEYLFGSKWNKGVNLLSITMILITIVGGSVIGFLLEKLIKMICNNMGPRGMTIGHLISSITRFVIFVIIIIWSLKELGFNLSALLAGAGIAGAALSFCASQTVNDILAGFFIVFEGSYQIGDWVMVDDWRGQVMGIGMRTTKIANSGRVRIINNSSLHNVTVMDPLNSGAIASIDIAYKEDAEKVIDLINSYRHLYEKEIPEIEDGPYVKGVMELGASGVTIEIVAYGKQQYIGRIERGIRLVSKRLFDENGIEIPFNQVTIHQAE